MFLVEAILKLRILGTSPLTTVKLFVDKKHACMLKAALLLYQKQTITIPSPPPAKSKLACFQRLGMDSNT